MTEEWIDIPGFGKALVKYANSRKRGSATATAAANKSGELKMRDVVKQNTGTEVATADQEGINYFTRYGESVRQTAIVGKLLKFSKGDWTVGQENEPIEEGSLFIANLDEFFVGWVRWANNKPTDHVMGKVTLGYQPPRRNELGDNDQDQWEVNEQGEARDPWQYTNYLLLQDEEKQLYTFTTSSQGGINAIGDLSNKFGKIYRQKPKQWPIVEISTGSYLHQNKAFGRIKYPIFTIVDWTDKSDFVEPDTADARTPDEVEDPAEQVTKVTPKPKAKQAAVAAAAASTKAPAKARSKARF